MFRKEITYALDYRAKSARHNGFNREPSNIDNLADAEHLQQKRMNSGYYVATRIVKVVHWEFYFWRFALVYNNSMIVPGSERS